MELALGVKLSRLSLSYTSMATNADQWKWWQMLISALSGKTWTLTMWPDFLADTWASESKLCEEFVKRIGPQNGSLMNRCETDRLLVDVVRSPLRFPLLAFRVKWLLDRAKRSVEEVNFLSGTPLAANQVPWAQIIDACVSSMLTSLHLDPGRSESEVHFFAEDRDKFVFPDQWRVSINLSKQEVAKADENKRWGDCGRNSLKLLSKFIGALGCVLYTCIAWYFVYRLQAQNSRCRSRFFTKRLG